MIKIFELEHADGELQWVSGHTHIEALNHYETESECDLTDMLETEIREIPKEKWPEYTIYEEDGSKKTFEELIRENPNRPMILGGTMDVMPEGFGNDFPD